MATKFELAEKNLANIHAGKYLPHYKLDEMQLSSSKQTAIKNNVEPQPDTSQSSASVRPHRRKIQKLFDSCNNEESLGKQEQNSSLADLGETI